MFDFDLAFNILETEKPHKVVLQFQDSLLSESILVYNTLQRQFRDNDIEFFINADSTWGSSADDISAKHVNGQIILFFGMDMTICHKMVFFIPFYASISVQGSLRAVEKTFDDKYSKTFLFYESSYYWLALKFHFAFERSYLVQSNLLTSRDTSVHSYETKNEIIGGFCVDQNLDESRDTHRILYIGRSNSQLTTISARFPEHKMSHFDPIEGTTVELPPRNRILAEHYGRISKVENADVIGIIIHSMSMDAVETKRVINSIESMIHRAGKQFYTFVIGRIDESKLENFPEIDLFCLVSIDATSVLKDKGKWRRPIISPFELEVGLGLRTWDAVIKADLDIISTAAEEFTSKSILDSLSEPDENRIIEAEQRALSVIEGRGSAYFSERAFKGLQAKSDVLNMDIVPGQFGTASGYVTTTK